MRPQDAAPLELTLNDVARCAQKRFFSICDRLGHLIGGARHHGARAPIKGDRHPHPERMHLFALRKAVSD
jgi:hypothetical protein